MSGVKRVTVNVDQQEYFRLQRSEGELRRIREDVPNLLNDLNRDFQNRMRPLQERQARYEQTVGHLQTDMQRVERETVQRLQEQERKMYAELSQQEKRFDKEIKTLARETERMMSEERRIRETQVRQVSADIKNVRDEIKAKEEYRRDVANRWIADAETIRDFIAKNHRHEQFAPGRLADVDRLVQQAKQNVAQHLPEPAISQAQDACRQFSDLRLELDRLEREWQMWLNTALNSSQELFEFAQKNRRCQAMDMDGKIEKDEKGNAVEIEVDFWTNGRLTAFEQKLADQIRMLKDASALSTQELRQIAEQANPAFRQELDQIVRDARLAVISSQLRFSIADVVVEKLAEQGFDLDGEAYEGEDMRAGFVTKVKNLNGDEVVIRIVPKAGNPTENELQIHSYDAVRRSEEDLRQRAQELGASLQETGMDVGKIDGTPGSQPDPLWKNLDAVRHAKPTQQR